MLLADSLNYRDRRFLIDHSVIVSADAVAAFYWTSPAEKWHLHDYPSIRPPFDQMWIEVNAPRFGGDHRDGSQGWPSNLPMQWGAGILTYDAKLDEVMTKCFDEPLPKAQMIAADQQTKWSIIVELFIKFCGLPPFCAATRTFALDQEGRVITYDDGDGNGATKFCYLGTFLKGDFPLPVCEHFDPYMATYSFFETLLLAISFMHCRNVIFQEVTPSAKEDRLRARKNKPPLLTHKTLVIDHMKSILRSQGGMDRGNSLKKAIHICRGYFAHYSEEKPLFGRVAGTFWVPQHIRGSKERGLVEKKYEVR